MKKTITFIFFFITAQVTFSQNNPEDVMLQKIAAEKNDSKRIDLIADFFVGTQDSDPIQDMQKAKSLLQQAHDEEDPISEALALSEIGYNYRSFGNTINGLEYNIKALTIAENTGNEELLASIKISLALYYKDLPDYPKALEIFHSAEALSLKMKNDKILSWAFSNLGEVYNSINKTDSALMYSQRAYELATRFGYTDLLGYICLQLGKSHGRMGNKTLALSYYDLSIKEALRMRSPKYMNQGYYAFAQYYNGIDQKDSAALYAKKAIASVENTAYSNMSIKPAKLLSGIYENSNNDSLVKYLKMYQAANDSLFSTKTIQQGQILSFESELQQQELAAEKEKTEEQRQQNIQYALLALGIVGFIIIFLLLSRGFITNEKLIEFLGILALLLVFEFLNLLLHPFLERITHHSPVLMLLGLVCIAAMLVPLHHKLEHWATKKLVEKNKAIRLAAAKKTIEKLDNGS